MFSMVYLALFRIGTDPSWERGRLARPPVVPFFPGSSLVPVKDDLEVLGMIIVAIGKHLGTRRAAS